MTVMQDVSFEVALKAVAENNRPISPAALSGLLSTVLYARQGNPFFVEPIIASLDSREKPFLCGHVWSRGWTYLYIPENGFVVSATYISLGGRRSLL